MNNTVHVIDAETIEDWPTLSKEDVGQKLAARIAIHLENNST